MLEVIDIENSLSFHLENENYYTAESIYRALTDCEKLLICNTLKEQVLFSAQKH